MSSLLRRTGLLATITAAVLGVTCAPASATTPRQRLDALVAQRSRSSTSVSVVDPTAKTTLTVGAASGMITASVAKLELLETLLAVRQSQHRRPTRTDRSHLARMIEHSSNADADWVFAGAGGRAGVTRWETRLGLRTRVTRIGHDGHWGLTTTSAAEQIALLRNLVDAHSPLDSKNRAYALTLMRSVERDQRWGVPVVATSGRPANKNGWLGVADDHWLWAVNSVGVVTVKGHTLLVSVLTQHDRSFKSGITRVETLARAAVDAAEARR